MIKAVLDTNVFISALFWQGTPYKVLKFGLEGKYILLTSLNILKELEGRLKNKFHFPDKDTNDFLEVITLNSYIVEPNEKLEIIYADPADNKIIECAAAGEAHFIVSGDNHLLKIKNYNRIKIVTPRDFLHYL